MLDKRQIIGTLNRFSEENQIPKEAILIRFGSAMVMRGLKKNTYNINVDLFQPYQKRLPSPEDMSNPFGPKTILHFGLIQLGFLTQMFPYETIAGYMVETPWSMISSYNYATHTGDLSNDRVITLRNRITVLNDFLISLEQ